MTNGSTAVVGAGTEFSANALVGDAIHLPGASIRTYEIVSITSDTEIEIFPAFDGPSVAGAAYAIQPTRGILQQFNSQVSAWIAAQKGYIDGPLSGLFDDGTADFPGIAFENEAGLGARRVGPGTGALVAGGADIIKWSSAGAVLAGLLTGTAVQQSATDTTAGRLLTVGAGGIVGQIIEFSGNIDDPDQMPSGFYRVQGVATGTKPDGLAAFNMIVMRRGQSSPYSQTSQFVTSTIGMLYREWNGTSWGAWSIQDEYGSNANGEYIRFANGTQICTTVLSGINVNIALGAIYFSDAITAQMPAQFVSSPYSAGSMSGTVYGWVNARSTRTQWALSVYSAVSRTNDSIRVFAVGRWF
ncbi:hypothetical protein [Thioclava dalianensis]|uniref:hypothetical protein n=1 Tax=Thioclava dalianensis TaxID=1185766 RepID=UPI001160445F|nr:hypothetical protein [Thioclava dalianensis]